MQSRMWDGEALRIYDGTAKQQYVDVDNAWSFLLRSPATHLLLDFENRGEQLPWHFFCFKSNCTIQKPRLRCEFHGLGFIERRYRDNVPDRGQARHSVLQVGRTLPQVRAE